MKKKTLSVLLILLAISNVIYAQSLFRSEKYKFRIKYPDTWVEKKGDGPNVVFKIVSGDGPNLNIVVREDKSIKGHTIDEYSLENFVNMIEKAMKSKYSDYEVLDYSKTYLDNQVTYSIFSKLTYKVLDKVVTGKMIQYSTIKGKYMYTITVAADIDSFDFYEPVFKEIISTLVFEDYY